MPHKRTHQIADQVKQNRIDRRNKKRQRKEKAVITRMRYKLGPRITQLKSVMWKLDLAEHLDLRILDKFLFYAESDPRFIQEYWDKKER